MDSRFASHKIQQMQAARTKLQALDVHIAATFTIAAWRGWKESGVDGMRTACWDAAQEIKNVEGAWDAFEALTRAASAV